jgi:Ca2+-binding EF-hand superfamily protein
MKLTKRIVVTALIAAIAMPVAGLAAKPERKKNKTAEAIPAFATVDKDSDESITETEFVAANEKLGADAAKLRFGTLDKNHDGKLSKEEYAAGATPEKKKRKKKNQE